MDRNKETYLVMLQETDPEHSFGDSIRSSFFTASNFKKAYTLALDQSNINDPSPGYRAALEQLRRNQAVTVREKHGSIQTIIALIKKY